MNTYKYADISTSHITAKDNEILQNVEVDLNPIPAPNSFPLTVAMYREGYFIPLGDTSWLMESKEELQKHGLSESFVDLLRYCINARVDVLRLDADADIIPVLKTFEW